MQAMTVLTRALRDSGFVEHRRGEPVTVHGKMRRSNFDETILLKVTFENGVRSVVLEADVEKMGPLPVLGN